MDEIDKLDVEFDWIIQLMLQNFELKRRVKGLLLYIDNLKSMLEKEEENKVPLPLNLDEIFI